MMDFDIQLTRRRVLASILVIGLAAAAAGVGTFALFSDEETSENSINAGTLELGSVNGSFDVDDLYPTQSTETQTISTSYEAGVASDLTVKVRLNESQDGFADQLAVETANLTVGDESYATGSGTLGDYEDTYSIGTVEGGEEIELTTNFTLMENTSNEYQNESVDIMVTFNATQQT